MPDFVGWEEAPGGGFVAYLPGLFKISVMKDRGSGKWGYSLPQEDSGGIETPDLAKQRAVLKVREQLEKLLTMVERL